MNETSSNETIIFIRAQERTRIALTAFHSKVLLNDQSWTLAKYDNHREVNNAINQLVIGGEYKIISTAVVSIIFA